MKLASATMRMLAFSAIVTLPAVAAGQATWKYTDWDNDGNLELSDQEFREGFGQSGTYEAWDRDRSGGLNEGEFATGMFSRWDADDDMQITQEEYRAGTERWYGADYDADFGRFDADGSGSVDRAEFGRNWDSEYYNEWDADDDANLTQDEFDTGVYGTADANNDMVISIEEEGGFEGWFDGDDIEAEIEQVGDVL